MLAGLTSVSPWDVAIGTAIGCTPKALVWTGVDALFF
jgi:uncharacterized membrane protein YdjX (TVP38/TMEM64 family)